MFFVKSLMYFPAANFAVWECTPPTDIKARFFSRDEVQTIKLAIGSRNPELTSHEFHLVSGN